MKRRQFIESSGYLGIASLLDFTQASAKSHPASGNGLSKKETTEAAQGSSIPISIHPENPKYFLFRAKPLVLVAASEHYGSIVNRRFDFARYLKQAAEDKQTVTRTFLLFRELQSARNPCSPVKPESPDFVAPWPRTGPGRAMDGEPIYDLDRWNPEYFERVHRFLSLASDLGIAVELTVFSNTYADNIWALNPLRAKNNRQGIGNVEWPDYITLKDQRLVERQSAYARKIVQETSRYDNIYYEICNEPGGGVAHHATSKEVDAWQREMGSVIRGELQRLGRRHLLFGQSAFSYAPRFSQDFDAAFSGPLFDAVNVHPLPGLSYQGRAYDLGQFMSKELKLAAFRDFFLAMYSARRPCVSDEDNAASLYRDTQGWTIHRKRAWIAVMTGSHYDYIDFSIRVDVERGTPQSRQEIRSWMRNLSEFIHSFDVIHSKPLPDWVESMPEHLVGTTLAVPDRGYIAYLADAREVTDPTAGQPISGRVAFQLPEGAYNICLYSPASGEYSPCMAAQGGKAVRVDLPSFQEDIVIRATRTEEA